MLAWLTARAVAGVEDARPPARPRGSRTAGGAGIEDASALAYRRTLRTAGGIGVVALDPRRDHVRATLRLPTGDDEAEVVARVRRLLDLDADPAAVAAALGADPALRPLLRRHPGVRVVGAVDGFESAVRAVLGQQVSLAAARTLAARIVRAWGQPLARSDGALTHAFPTAAALAGADLDAVGMPAARRAALRELARRAADGRLALDPPADPGAARRALLAIPGVGEWTASYVALRSLGDADAFPAGDLGLRRAAAALGLPADAAGLAAHAERWRPWRAYAAHLLWAGDT